MSIFLAVVLGISSAANPSLGAYQVAKPLHMIVDGGSGGGSSSGEDFTYCRFHC
jgi:hypothetical protein